MPEHNLSVETYFQRITAEHRPAWRFAGQSQTDWQTWRDNLFPKVVETLGRMPEMVDPQPQVIAEWREDGLIKQKLIFNVEKHLAATAYINRPADATGRLPAIFCCHGHGQFGKEPVMGNRSRPDLNANINTHNYDYGHQMAQAGFVTMAIDWRGFGERNDRIKPHFLHTEDKRDQCNLHYLRATILGMTVLGMNIHDAKTALNVLCDQPFVDPDRLGVMGLSLGGTMTTWLAICDDRLKAADIICYSDRFADFGMRDINFCGSQITPGLYALCDVPDLHGLIAPKPLLVEIGTYDNCFMIESAQSCYREVEKIYAAAGVRDKLELDLFPGTHAWGGNKSIAFFQNAL